MFLAAGAAAAPATQPAVERWGVFDLALPGPSNGNPFVDVWISAVFYSGKQSITLRGFYDDDGIYRVRFSPPELGLWQYRTESNVAELSGKTGELNCIAPAADNHGPVRVANVYHFAYADGTPFVPIGTTSYGWAHEPDAMEDQTLVTLKASPFNKVRMQLLPGKSDALFFPYPDDHSRFNVQFFRHLERRIGQLSDIGVQADLILFNPYSKGTMAWFDDLDDAADDRLLRYVVARLGAYRNVWWSLANEYGQVKHKTDSDWDHFFQVVQAEDASDHLRSIHNAAKFYDPNKPWVTHASIQNGAAVSDFGRASIYRDTCRKPIVFDEVGYEGNLKVRWGDLTAQEEVKRCWLGTIAGAYVGHGEVISSPQGHSWTSDGGVLMGESPPRLAFLRKILEAGPAEGIEPIDEFYETHIGGKAGQYYLVYFGEEKPTTWTFALPRDPPAKNALAAGMKFHVDVLDTWNMTQTPVDGVFTLGKSVTYAFSAVDGAAIALPGRPYMALRIQRIP